MFINLKHIADNHTTMTKKSIVDYKKQIKQTAIKLQ